MNNYQAPPDRAITLTEAAAMCGCSEQTAKNWQKRDTDPFPGPINDVPHKGKLYSELAVLEWAGRNAIRTAKIVRG